MTLAKRSLYLLAFCPAALTINGCDDNVASCPGGAECASASTSGGFAESTGASAANGTPADTEAEDEGEDEDEDTGSAGLETGSSTSLDGSMDMDAGDDGYDDDGEPPEVVPFGGRISWGISSQNVFGTANFYSTNWDKGALLPVDETPIAALPPVDDMWTDPFVGKEPYPPEGAEAESLAVADAFTVSSGAVVADVTLGDLRGGPTVPTWNVSGMHEDEYTAEEPWTIELPASDAFPAASLSTPAHPLGVAEWAVVLDEAGALEQLSWTPRDGAYAVQVAVAAFTASFALQLTCVGVLADDGSADIPELCSGTGMPDDPIASYSLSLEHVFLDDLEYDGYRIRTEERVWESLLVSVDG